MAKGLIDRFRSLPMARSAVLSGRTFSDVVYNAGILVVLMLVRPRRRLARAHGLRRLLRGRRLLLFSPSRWRGSACCSACRADRRGRPAARLHWSSSRSRSSPTRSCRPQTLPDWLQPIANWNPVSALTAATRELFGNPNPFAAGLPGRASDPALGPLDHRAARGLRAARGPEVPLDRPLGGDDFGVDAESYHR